MRTNAKKKIEEYNKTLTAYDFSGMSYVKAKDEPGNEYFFESAFARTWKDPEDGQKYYMIFPEHAEPIFFEAEDYTITKSGKRKYVWNESYCIQMKRTNVKRIK